jgi:uncharacterized protein (DUF2252 family)
MPSDAVAQRILRYNAGRDPDRLELKFKGMRAAPFTFFRATAHLFYEFNGLLKTVSQAPAVWSSGDVHLENFGCFKADNRLAYFDLNDFDEAALGPLSWDLVRLIASAMLGAGPASFSSAERKDVGREILGQYGATLANGKARWLERATSEGPIRRLLQQAKRRTRRLLLNDRTRRQGSSRQFRLRPDRHLVASKSEQKAVAAVLKRLARRQPDPAFFRVRDVVRRVAGMASLGVTRYAVVVEGRGSPNNNYLLDLKGALPSVLAAASPYRQPRWASDAERVVTVQNWVQAVPPALLAPLSLRGRPVVLRELQPTADRLRTADWRSTGVELSHLADAVANVTAWSHLRAAGRHGADGIDTLIAYGHDRSWQKPVLKTAFEAARRIEAEWEEFCVSFDAGVLA